MRAALVSAAHTMTTLHVDQAELERRDRRVPGGAGAPRAGRLPAPPRHPRDRASSRRDRRRPARGGRRHHPARPAGGGQAPGDRPARQARRRPPVRSRDPPRRPRGRRRARSAARPPRAHRHPRGGGHRGRAARRPRALLRQTPRACAPSGSPPCAILADPEAAGASYIDVRLPGRPAAGGLPAETLAPVAPAGSADLAAPTGHRTDRSRAWIRPPSSSPRRPRPATEPPRRRAPRRRRRPRPHPPSQPPLPPIPPGLEAFRRLPDNPHPLVELQGNPRPSLECLPAGFLARTIDTSRELRLQCGVCGGRKPSTLA